MRNVLSEFMCPVSCGSEAEIFRHCPFWTFCFLWEKKTVSAPRKQERQAGAEYCQVKGWAGIVRFSNKLVMVC